MSRVFLIVGTMAFAWFAMEALHEFGHVLGALATGGEVRHVDLNPLRFSSTYVDPNPNPLIEVAAGPAGGCFLPTCLWLAAAAAGRLRFAAVLRFVCGFCLIANGAYLGFGWIVQAGDAAELLRLGVAGWIQTIAGVPAIAAGLYAWNGLGKHFGVGANAPPVRFSFAGIVWSALVALALVECLLGTWR